MKTLTGERLRELLYYDPETGVMRWKAKRGNATTEGKVAGTRTRTGYLQVSVDGRLYLAHRLAWLYMHDEWPTGEIDHANGIRTDNRLRNLRVATRSKNRANVRKYRNNTSGYRGVCFDKANAKWLAQISVEGRNRYLGLYATAEEAGAAAAEARHLAFGEFDGSGRVDNGGAP